MIEVFKIKQKYDTTIVPEMSVNCSSVTRGNKYKLFNQTFTTTYGVYTEDTPRFVCGARRLSEARLFSDIYGNLAQGWI